MQPVVQHPNQRGQVTSLISKGKKILCPSPNLTISTRKIACAPCLDVHQASERLLRKSVCTYMLMLLLEIAFMSCQIALLRSYPDCAACAFR